jgi:tRNA nucleotidyltransferase/poly(A) polymerase
MEKNQSKYNNAVSIVRKLKENGHEAYFVGG